MHTWFHVQLDLKNLGRTLMCVSSIYVTAAAVPDPAAAVCGGSTSKTSFFIICTIVSNIVKSSTKLVISFPEYSPD